MAPQDEKSRTLCVNNPRLQEHVLAFHGGLQLLQHLGFFINKSLEKFVCHNLCAEVVQSCIICLENTIAVLQHDAALQAGYTEMHSKSQFGEMTTFVVCD